MNSKRVLSEVNSIARDISEPVDRLTFSGEFHRRKNRKAAITRQHYRETGCEFVMTFVEFRQQGVRNKILRKYGLPAVYLPGEGQPNTIH